MKIYSTAPEGNQMADLEPALYFNTAIEQILEVEEWLRTADEGCQPLLVHIDIFVYLSKKYPEMANRRVAKLNRSQIKETFYTWFERSGKKYQQALEMVLKNQQIHCSWNLIKFK